ncbi:MAG: hypothetical protein E3J41_02910 [Candidatus Cloacimonadota bacterium]|nr:MAG: hypothetical protein E3J41_02910 [Candidatus Cloacimonadota bacterium]
MRIEVLREIAQFLNSFEVDGLGLYKYLDWVDSEGSGYEIYVQHLIVHSLRAKGIDVTMKGKKNRGDCDFFYEGEAVELKTPRDTYPNKYEEAFIGHPKADSYLFIHKGKKHYEEACIKAEEHYTMPLAGDDWWLTWMRLDDFKEEVK